MSQEITTVTSTNNASVNLTSFSGGVKRGSCVQLTQRTMIGKYQSVNMDKTQAAQMVAELQEWLGEQ